MTVSAAQIAELKTILETISAPEQLANHPWVNSLTVQQERQTSPGVALVSAISKIFQKTIPAAPPRRGKRLDTRWGEFGLLAAQYFVPYAYGTSVPNTLRDAWGRIDESILLFAFPTGYHLTSDDRARYQLVGPAIEMAPISTLSDWNRKGLERLAEAFFAQEQYLSHTLECPSPLLGSHPVSKRTTRRSTPHLFTIFWKRILPLALFIFFLIAVTWLGLKAWRVYQIGLSLEQNLKTVQQNVQKLQTPEDLRALEGPLNQITADVTSLRQEVEPFLPLTSSLGWVPQYGGEIVQSAQLLDTVYYALTAAQHSYHAALPFLDAYEGEQDATSLTDLTGILLEAQPDFEYAERQLKQAQAARDKVDLNLLSPRVRNLILNELDPALRLLQDALDITLVAPRLLGASQVGPQTYLILIQNEDELRPTGGFITAVGSMVVRDGQLVKIAFENSNYLEDWGQLYPLAPWQLDEYMNSEILVLRDSNWYTDFPYVTEYAEYLYALKYNHTVDGVIAFNQHTVVKLLEVIGPIEIPGQDRLIDSTNILEFMRQSKTPPPEDKRPADWDRKDFIGELAGPMLKRILAGQGFTWKEMGKAIQTLLDERHILIQSDDPIVTSLLTRRAWDGAVRPENTDYLLTVDFNVGFSKTNAVVETSYTYQVDLIDTSAPTSHLNIKHTNNSDVRAQCKNDISIREIFPEQAYYNIDDCYKSYLRIYLPQGTTLITSTPHAVPAEWTLLGNPVPARTDILREKIDGVQAFGTLIVVPGQQTTETSFTFALPPSILQVDPITGLTTYRLHLQKQAGTIANPVQLSIQLPTEAQIQSLLPQSATIENGQVTLQTDLRQDRFIEIVFSLPKKP